MQLATPEDIAWLNQCFEAGLLDRAAVIGMLAQQKKDYEALEQQLKGTVFLIDPREERFQVQRGAELVYQQSLSIFPQNAHPWDIWGKDLVATSADAQEHRISLPTQLDSPYGLILNQLGCLAYQPDYAKQAQFMFSTRAYFNGLARQQQASGPYDLYLEPEAGLCVLSNRGAGKIQIFALPDMRLLHEVKLREAGHSACLHLAYDAAAGGFWFSDQISSHLGFVALDSGEIRTLTPGHGVLGNLCLAPDQKHLYLYSIKPTQQILYYDPHRQELLKTIALKGDLLSVKRQDPCDLMCLSQDQKYLLVHTFQPHPDPYTSIFSLIDTEAIKTVKRYALRDRSQPCLISYSQPNPLKAFAQQDLHQMLLTSGLVSPAKMQEIEAYFSPEPEPARINPAPEIVEAETFFTPPSAYVPNKPIATTPKTAAPAGDVPKRVAPIPEPVAAEPVPDLNQAAYLELGPEFTDIISDTLIEAFQAQTGQSLRDQPHLMARLYQEAETLRQGLQTHDPVRLEIKSFYLGQHFETVLRRRQVLLKHDYMTWVMQQEQRVIPFDCPACHQKLMGWECHVCGYELESPLRQFQSEIAAIDPLRFLEPGQFLVPDARGIRLLRLNSQKQVIWCLNEDQFSCEQPVDVVYLPNQNYLVVDQQGDQIYEIGSRGKIYHSFAKHLSPEHHLKQPVRIQLSLKENRSLSAENLKPDDFYYWIVDSGHHRIFKSDAQSRIHWQYGHSDQPSDHDGYLNSPQDLHVTPTRTLLIADTGNQRVLELDLAGKIEHIFDISWGLVRPVLARKLWNGHILIVDADSFQVLEIDSQYRLKDRFSYYKPGMPEEIKLSQPTGLLRLPNQDLILFNHQKVIHVLPQQKKLVWFANLADLKLHVTPTDAASPATVAEVKQPPLAPRPQPEIKVERTPTIAKPTAIPRPAVQTPQSGFKGLGPKQTAQERLQALLERKTPVPTKESYEHSVLFSRPDTPLTALMPFVIDSRHNGIIRLNRNGKLIWHYGFEMGHMLSKPNFIQETPHSLIVTDTESAQILEISKADKEILHVLKGLPPFQLEQPRSALLLDNGHYLVADARKKALLEFDSHGNKVWAFKHEVLLSAPQYVELLANGHLLYVDSLHNRVTEIDRQGHVKWYYGKLLPGQQGYPAKLFGPCYATRLPNGNTLIADTRHHRVLEVNAQGETVWDYLGHARNSRINPNFVQRLPDGHTLISYFNSTRLVEIDTDKHCVWSYTVGKDVFLPPVAGDDEQTVQHDAEKPVVFYNALEKRLMQEALDRQKDLMEFHIELMDGVQMKSVRAQLIMRCIEQYATVFKSFPSPEDILADRVGKFMVISCILDSNAKKAALRSDVANIAEVLSVQVHVPKLNS